MGISTPHKHLLLILKWYALTEPRAIVIGYLRYARALQEIIPFAFLVMTLLCPWKNIREKKTYHGFNLTDFLERLTLNLFSRCVGAVVRIFTIIFGVLLQIILLAAFLGYLTFWVAYPFAALAGIHYLITSL